MKLTENNLLSVLRSRSQQAVEVVRASASSLWHHIPSSGSLIANIAATCLLDNCNFYVLYLYARQQLNKHKHQPIH